MFWTSWKIRRLQKPHFIKAEHGSLKRTINLLERFTLENKRLPAYVLFQVQSFGGREYNWQRCSDCLLSYHERPVQKYLKQNLHPNFRNDCADKRNILE